MLTACATGIILSAALKLTIFTLWKLTSVVWLQMLVLGVPVSNKASLRFFQNPGKLFTRKMILRSFNLILFILNSSCFGPAFAPMNVIVHHQGSFPLKWLCMVWVITISKVRFALSTLLLCLPRFLFASVTLAQSTEHSCHSANWLTTFLDTDS